MRKIDIKKSFGASVRVWRNQLGLSQEELAERANLHRTYVSDLECGRRNVSLEIIERLAQALEVSTSRLFAASAPQGEPVTGKLVNILLVEDNADDAILTRLALKRANIANQIHLASDGEAALDYLFCLGLYSRRPPEDEPQMILLDLNLPKIDGIEVLRQIKANQRTRHIPVVVLTASSRSQDVAESRRLGADTYIVKPVDFQNLSEVTPRLNFQWALLKPAHNGKTNAGMT